jgi:hypothetical protein
MDISLKLKEPIPNLENEDRTRSGELLILVPRTLVLEFHFIVLEDRYDSIHERKEK